MTCVCSLAGTAACKMCWNNPESTGQFNNFVSWNTTSNYVNHVMDEITKRDVEQVSERLRALGWEEVVRCRDCKFYQPKEGAMLSCKFEYHDFTQWKLAEPDGFCAWGERDMEWVTCKCGEDIERRDRIQTCPSCGRKVYA